MQRKYNHPVSKVLILIPLVILISYACNKSKQKPDLRIDYEKELKEISKDKGYGHVPFYKKGSLAFLDKEAIRAMKIRNELAKFEKEKSKGAKSAAKKKKGPEMTASAAQTQESVQEIGNLFEAPPPRPTEHLDELKEFPKDVFGYPDWTVAVNRRLIEPIDSIEFKKQKKEKKEEYIADILYEIKDKIMANVLFPHRVHNYWLSCEICHPSIFIPERGANRFLMKDIWNGEYCGRCHGKVAFQAKGFDNCIRCHSQRRKNVF